VWGLLPPPSAAAARKREATFVPYDVDPQRGETKFVDFDGDGLDDLIVIRKPKLLFFFQDAETGFPKSPDLTCTLGAEPCVLWTAKLRGGPGRDILVMTHAGVASLACSGRTSAPEKAVLISRETVLPAEAVGSTPTFFPLAVRASNTSLILVPTQAALEIWGRGAANAWRREGALDRAVHCTVLGPTAATAYRKHHHLDLGVQDVNHDGLDDLVLCRNRVFARELQFRVHLQTPQGRFGRAPSSAFSVACSCLEHVHLDDVNRDGRIDLIRTTPVREPWFIPGSFSPKVVTRVHLADSQGNLPDAPDRVFRKNDWSPWLPIVDIDGDGRRDLVLGYMRFKGRSDVVKLVKSRKVAMSLRVHFCDETGYRQTPDCVKDVDISIERIHLQFDFHLMPYLLKTFTSFDGDFNGDGRRDLLVKNDVEELAVHFFKSRDAGFSTAADLRFRALRTRAITVRDLNHDGISDVVAASRRKRLRIFLSETN